MRDPLRRLVLALHDGAEETVLLALLRDALGVTNPAQAVGQDHHDLVRRACWDLPLLPTTVLESAVGGRTALRSMAGRGPVRGECPLCARAVRAQDRDEVDRPPEGPCGRCAARTDRPVDCADTPPPSPSPRPSQLPRRSPTGGGDLFRGPQGSSAGGSGEGLRRRRVWAEHYPRHPLSQ